MWCKDGWREDTRMKEICDECYECLWYWQNNDTENKCNGQERPCHEFVKVEVE